MKLTLFNADKRLSIIFLALFILALNFASCVPEKTPISETKIQEKTVAADIPSWEQKWASLIKMAQKEGRLVLYTTVQPEVRQVMAESFEKKSEVKVEIITGRGGEISTRILNERRAGLFLADTYVGGTTTLLTQLKPAGAIAPVMPLLFLPEVTDEKLWYKGTLPFMDREKMILQTRYTPGGDMMNVAFDPKLVKKDELASWQDLLNPKFKGKMNLQDPTTAGKGGKFINKALNFYGLNWDYLRALARQEPVITRDERLMIEWIVKGKHIIAINPHNEQYDIFKKAGGELDFSIFKESRDILGGGSYNLAMIDRPVHPASAKLFANWFLSKEGQSIISRAAGIQSAREDTPVDYLPDYQRRKPGTEYFIETEEFVVNEEKLRPMILEVFGPLIK